MVTVGELLKALKTNIFSITPTNDFEVRCLARENGLKQYLNIIGVMVNQHITKPELSDQSISHWKKEKIKKCLKNLAEYTDELVNELQKEKIEKYCKQLTRLNFFRNPFEPDIVLLTLNSYYGTIVSDIFWISEITIMEAMEISTGKLDISELGKKTPQKLVEIKSQIKNIAFSKLYNKHLNTIEEALHCYKNKYYKAFNLLLLTSIEGLTRTLGAFLIKKQGLEIDLFSPKFNSLDSFLRTIPWKNDLKISKLNLSFITGDYEKLNYNDVSANVPDRSDITEITLKTRLDFLRRRFKENRDLILHGQETEYNKPYYGFVNASALYELLEVIIIYQKIYQ